jgi:hypothetical protein
MKTCRLWAAKRMVVIGALGGSLRLMGLTVGFVGALAVACSQSPDVAREQSLQTIQNPSLQYTVIADEVDESPGKTQVAIDLVVPQDAPEAGLREVLLFLYDDASQRTGFQHHSNPTVIGIYAYPSREHAESGMGQWSAMLSKTPGDDEPAISIGLSVGQSAPPSERFGFTTEERTQIFGRIVTDGDRAQAEAERQASVGDTATLADFTRQNDLASELEEQYKDELATEFGLTREQLSEISLEGLQNNWPLPQL